MAGIGKTTLAQFVYNDDVVINHFNSRIWVCATDSFDKGMVAKDIAQALFLGDANGKKFFLVVDDVWTVDYREWEPFEEALRKGAPGSRILVTTRKTEVAQMMRAKSNMITLEALSEEVCWTIFSRLAFSDGDERDELEQIGRQITIGSLMSFKEPTREDWNDVLKSELWEMKKFKDEPLKL
ncbi:hypothetical protein UlMin_026983 [Ulmus minor]